MRAAHEDRPEDETLDAARDRIASVAELQGADSQEYATALNGLALILIVRGEPGAAEPLLRQALEVSRGALGENHPEYAANLSSLAGLLWSRGDLDEAETLLRRAAAICSESLGAGHPKSVVSSNSLDQLMRAKRDISTSRPPDEGAPTVEAPAPPPRPQTEMTRRIADTGELSAGLERLGRDFVGLGDRLAQIGEGLRTGAIPDGDDLADAFGRAGEDFESLRRGAEELSRSYSVSIPGGGVSNLAEIAALLPQLKEAEAGLAKAKSARQEAARVLDRVERLGCPSDLSFSPLSACRESALDVRRTIDEAPLGRIPDVGPGHTEALDHLKAVLNLVEADDSVGDALWADWYSVVVKRFGEPLAVAVARSRVVLTGD